MSVSEYDIFNVSGPCGTGKDSLINGIQECDDRLYHVSTITTKKVRSDDLLIDKFQLKILIELPQREIG